MNSKLKRTFIITFIIPTLYGLAWNIFKWTELYWSNDLNILGFLFIAGSYPWNHMFLDPDCLVYMKHLIGQRPSNLMGALVLALGFAINITVVSFVVSWTYAKWKAHNKPM